MKSNPNLDILKPGGDEFWSKKARDMAQILITFGNFDRKELIEYLINHVTLRNKRIQERHVLDAAEYLYDKHEKEHPELYNDVLFNPPVNELSLRDWKRMGYWRLVLGKDERNRRYKELRGLGLSMVEAQKGRDLPKKDYEYLLSRLSNKELWMSSKTVENPVESYISKATAIIRDDPKYRGHFIVATGFMVRQCKVIFKKKTIRVYSLSSPEMKRKIDKAAFAFENEKIRDIMLNKLLTKVQNKYIIKRVKDKWYFDKIDKKISKYG